MDIRPFSIVNDAGLRCLVQECISLGAKYGNIHVDDILFSADTTSSQVAKLANEYRSIIRQKLIEPLSQHAVTICPDLWSDSHRQVSYLGISVCFTDENHQFFAYDLCCHPYTEVDKSAENIIIAIKKALEPFGITDLSQINFVSDRGPNFVKALKSYSPTYCVGHRLNNIIKTCFYQTGKIKYKADDYITNETIESVCSSDSEDDNDNYDRCTILASSFGYDLMDIDAIDIPSSAANILKTISSCKNLDQGGVAVLQATVVKWLSMSQLLESINRSYRQIKKILGDRKKIIVLDKLIILQLIILLRPFKHIILFLQKGKEPTLHLVTIAILTLRDAFNTHKSLLEYGQSYQANPSGEELEEDDEYLEESEGVRFFRIRLYQLLNTMFVLEPIHLAATLLHPRYKLLKKCSSYEVRECYAYIRTRMAHIKAKEKNKTTSSTTQGQTKTTDDANTFEPAKKKPKRFGEDFETGNVSDEFDDEHDDELSKYLKQRIDINSIKDNPLTFWYENRFIYPILSQLARSIFSIPATTANVERQFSAGGLMVNSRRTRLNPQQINNSLFIRSVKKNE
ncbi:unnamed protein product [Rotaria sp. Silwood1]|nr:unnamed protein product [Rotaria sp. Silwood1]